MKHYNYSNIKEMIQCVEKDLTQGQRVIDGWQENNQYVLVISNGVELPQANFRIKLPLPQ